MWDPEIRFVYSWGKVTAEKRKKMIHISDTIGAIIAIGSFVALATFCIVVEYQEEKRVKEYEKRREENLKRGIFGDE